VSFIETYLLLGVLYTLVVFFMFSVSDIDIKELNEKQNLTAFSYVGAFFVMILTYPVWIGWGVAGAIRKRKTAGQTAQTTEQT
jgi:hypothetical protein